jgi:putative transcriptional regulator
MLYVCDNRAGMDIKALRTRLGMSQIEFSVAYRLSIDAIRQWEQGRRAPSGAAAVLLRAIERDPEAMRMLVS